MGDGDPDIPPHLELFILIRDPFHFQVKEIPVETAGGRFIQLSVKISIRVESQPAQRVVLKIPVGKGVQAGADEKSGQEDESEAYVLFPDREEQPGTGKSSQQRQNPAEKGKGEERGKQDANCQGKGEKKKRERHRTNGYGGFLSG